MLNYEEICRLERIVPRPVGCTSINSNSIWTGPDEGWYGPVPGPGTQRWGKLIPDPGCPAWRWVMARYVRGFFIIADESGLRDKFLDAIATTDEDKLPRLVLTLAERGAAK